MIAQLDRPIAIPAPIVRPVRALATLIHRRTGAEVHADVWADSDSYADVTHAIRQQFGYDWEIFESWIPVAPF
jgi:hypothetical protein